MSGFATWILTGGVALTIIQIKEARKSTNAQIAVDLFDKLRDEETKNTLRFIYSIDRNNFPILRIIDSYRIENLIDKFELLGALANEEIVDKHLAIESYAGPPAIRCWFQLADFLRKMNKKRGFYDIDFEDFVRRSIEYFKDKEIEVIFDNEYYKNKPLVEELSNWIEKNEELAPRFREDILKQMKANKRL